MIDYAAHGVREYWLVNAKLQVVEVFHLDDGRFRAVSEHGGGEIESVTVKGFKVRVRSIFDREVNMLELRRIMSGQ